MTKPLSEEQVRDLRLMCDPVSWPIMSGPILGLMHRKNFAAQEGHHQGLLVYAAMVQRFMFYEGLGKNAGRDHIMRFLSSNHPRGPLLAFELEDLIREGWSVDRG